MYFNAYEEKIYLAHPTYDFIDIIALDGLK